MVVHKIGLWTGLKEVPPPIAGIVVRAAAALVIDGESRWSANQNVLSDRFHSLINLRRGLCGHLGLVACSWDGIKIVIFIATLDDLNMRVSRRRVVGGDIAGKYGPVVSKHIRIPRGGTGPIEPPIPRILRIRIETEMTNHPSFINSSDNRINPGTEVIATKGRRRRTISNDLMGGKLDPYNQIRGGRSKFSEIVGLVIEKTIELFRVAKDLTCYAVRG